MQRPDKHAIIVLEQLLSAALPCALLVCVSGQPQTIIIYNLYTTVSLDGRRNLKQLQMSPFFCHGIDKKLNDKREKSRGVCRCEVILNLGVIFIWFLLYVFYLLFCVHVHLREIPLHNPVHVPKRQNTGLYPNNILKI